MHVEIMYRSILSNSPAQLEIKDMIKEVKFYMDVIYLWKYSSKS